MTKTMPTDSEITLWIASRVALWLNRVKPGHRNDSEEATKGGTRGPHGERLDRKQ